MSRPQRELRLIELLRSLQEHRVEHVVFGAVAVAFYGHVRGTAGLDVVVRPTQVNLGRVHDWLVSVDAHLRLKPERRFGPRERWRMFKGSNATVLTKLGQVDVVQEIPGLPAWDRLIAESERYELEDLTVARDGAVDPHRAQAAPKLAPRPRRHRGDRAARPCRTLPDVAFGYPEPLPEAIGARGHLCFLGDGVDVEVSPAA